VLWRGEEVTTLMSPQKWKFFIVPYIFKMILDRSEVAYDLIKTSLPR